jgi:hypothetical protein
LDSIRLQKVWKDFSMFSPPKSLIFIFFSRDSEWPKKIMTNYFIFAILNTKFKLEFHGLCSILLTNPKNTNKLHL